MEMRRRGFLLGAAAGACAAGGGTLGERALPERAAIPPPGTDLARLCARCTGCNLCVAKCQTKVLKAATLEYGICGTMMPVMDFARGYCEKDCTRCGEVCPTGAIRRLTKDEKALATIYNKVLTIARTEKAVANGVSFDLMYVNGDYHRQYAFLRKAGSEVLLVVVNFDDLPSTMDVTIPAHAFDYLKLKERKNVTAVDLLTGKEIKRQLYRDCYVSVDLEPLGAVILKFKA